MILIALTRPILEQIPSAFPATSIYDFIFYVFSGTQVTQNRLIIKNNSTLSIVYDQTISSTLYKHNLPAYYIETTTYNSNEKVRYNGRLYKCLQTSLGNLPTDILYFEDIGIADIQNGIQYKVTVLTGDSSSNWSLESDSVLFYCFEIPTVTIDNIIGGLVLNQDWKFEGTYTHTDTLQSYRYFLYDATGVTILLSSDDLYDLDEGNLAYTFAGLINNTFYQVEVKTLSIHNQEGTSGKITFKPLYIAPQLDSALTLENKPDEGTIEITANIVQVLGKLYTMELSTVNDIVIETNNLVPIEPENLYINNDTIDLIDITYNTYPLKVKFSGGFNVTNSNFIMKIWCKNITLNKYFCKLHSENNCIALIKSNEISDPVGSFRINALKFGVPFPSDDDIDKGRVLILGRSISNVLEFTDNDNIMILLKQIDSNMEISVTLVT